MREGFCVGLTFAGSCWVGVLLSWDKKARGLSGLLFESIRGGYASRRARLWWIRVLNSRHLWRCRCTSRPRAGSASLGSGQRFQGSAGVLWSYSLPACALSSSRFESAAFGSFEGYGEGKVWLSLL